MTRPPANNSPVVPQDPFANEAEGKPLLEQCRTQWQYGDWETLSRLTHAEVAENADRDKVAALVAAAHGQLGQTSQARQFAGFALDWGCDRDIVSRVLLGAIHNSLARAALCLEEPGDASAHFDASLRLVEPQADIDLLSHNRRLRETARLGLLPQANALLGDRLQQIEQAPEQFDPEALQALKSDISVIRIEMEAARKRHQLETLSQAGVRTAPPKRSETEGPYVVVVAGVPRSGSTWIYNAVRVLSRRAKQKTYAAWCEDYDPDAHPTAAIHLVKLHNAKQLDFRHDVLITSYRDLTERVASLIRMGWVKSDPDAIRRAAGGQAKLHAYWAGRSDLELLYQDIMGNPVKPLSELARLLEMKIFRKGLIAAAKELDKLKSPSDLQKSEPHDARTLMHPEHRGSDEERDALVAMVRKVLLEPAEP